MAKNYNLATEITDENKNGEKDLINSVSSEDSVNYLENEIENLIQKYEKKQKRSLFIYDSLTKETPISGNKSFSNFLEKKDYNIFKFFDLNSSINIKENHFNFEDKRIIKENFLPMHSFSKINNDSFYTKKSYTEDNNFLKKYKKTPSNNKSRKTNSDIFYFNHFSKKLETFKFNTKILSQKTATIESQNNQCQFCFKHFTYFLGIPQNVYWCTYFLKFICEKCISNEYSVIPAFILKHWNFNKFPVSKTAREILMKWYNKNVIHIKNNDPILQQAYLLRKAIILKRKIQMIFDLMKCDKAESFVLKTLKEDNYLVLKQNLFSLKDLCEINDYKLINKLNSYFKKFEHHIIKECVECCYKGGSCKICMNNEILLAYNIEDVFYCHDCKNTFHRTCCSVHPCVINR